MMTPEVPKNTNSLPTRGSQPESNARQQRFARIYKSIPQPQQPGPAEAGQAGPPETPEVAVSKAATPTKPLSQGLAEQEPLISGSDESKLNEKKVPESFSQLNSPQAPLGNQSVHAAETGSQIAEQAEIKEFLNNLFLLPEGAEVVLPEAVQRRLNDYFNSQAPEPQEEEYIAPQAAYEDIGNTSTQQAETPLTEDAADVLLQRDNLRIYDQKEPQSYIGTRLRRGAQIATKPLVRIVKHPDKKMDQLNKNLSEQHEKKSKHVRRTQHTKLAPKDEIKQGIEEMKASPKPLLIGAGGGSLTGFVLDLTMRPEVQHAISTVISPAIPDVAEVGIDAFLFSLFLYGGYKGVKGLSDFINGHRHNHTDNRINTLNKQITNGPGGFRRWLHDLHDNK